MIYETLLLDVKILLREKTKQQRDETPVDSITSFVVVANPNLSPCPESDTPEFSLAQVDSRPW
jgi:hypothetical protein